VNQAAKEGTNAMLVLSRKINQSIMVGDNVRIVVVAVDRDQVKLGIEAPRDIPVHRSEIYEEIQRTNQSAAASPVPAERSKPERRPYSLVNRPKKAIPTTKVTPAKADNKAVRGQDVSPD
jgi:carbon storage regulator